VSNIDQNQEKQIDHSQLNVDTGSSASGAAKPAGVEEEVWSSTAQLEHRSEQLAGLREEVRVKQSRIAALEARLTTCEAQLSVANATLAAAFNSKVWRLISVCRNIRVRLRQNTLLRQVASLVEGVLNTRAPHRSYERWIQRREVPTIDKTRIRESIATFKYTPKVSIVMPVYNTPEKLLNLAIESVRAQYYENWELCICDDASSQARVHSILESWSYRDARIRVTSLPDNLGVAAASNQALQSAEGEFVGFVDHDDELSPNALYEVAHLLQEHPDADVVYSDEDKLGVTDKREQPFFKPDWSPEYLLSCMYTCHFGVYRKAVLDQIGGFRPGFDGSQDYDLVLRTSEQTNRIYHIPKVLYHWRMTRDSTARSGHAKPHAFFAAKQALAEHLNRRGIRGAVLDGAQVGHYRVRFEVNPCAKVSIIIPTRDNVRLLRKCIRSIESKTGYANYEIVIVDNQSSSSGTTTYLSSLSHKVVPFSGPFNFSQILNYGARECNGDCLLFLNNDAEVIAPDWLDTMLGICQQKEIGVVGAKLLFRGGRIQHVGVVLGLGGPAGHPLRGFPRNTGRHFGIASDMRNCSAVTAACMMVRRQVFEEVRGFDENLPVAYNDVDFCLRVRAAGYRIVFAPDAELYHHESASRGYDLDPSQITYFQQRWGTLLLNDPYYNPNLTLQHEDMGYRF